MKKNSVTRAVLVSILCMVVILAFYSVGGAIAQINEMNHTDTIWVSGVFAWLPVVVALVFQKLRKKSLQELGFIRGTRSGYRRIYYCIPGIVAVILGVVRGMQKDGAYIAACFFFAAAAGFAEEIYYRGYIFQVWKGNGIYKAILISSLLFGLSHSANLIGGAKLYETLIQIVFAIIFGIVAAFMYSMSKSLWPCIFLHFLNNFIAESTNEGSNTQEIIIVTSKVVLLFAYLLLLLWRYRKEKKILDIA